MSALWVLLELGSMAALLLLVGLAVVTREKSRPNFGDADEPDWWPDFEREFALYAASHEPAPQRPRRSGELPGPERRRPG